MTASPAPAPAAMPSEEEIAEIVWRDRFHSDLGGRTARAILALFAPILAEKEREVAAALDSHDAWATSWSAKLDAAEARALAAESALAAAREALEPFAKVASEFDEGWLDCDEVAVEPMEDESPNGLILFKFDVADFRRAAAIRAQGE